MREGLCVRYAQNGHEKFSTEKLTYFIGISIGNVFSCQSFCCACAFIRGFMHTCAFVCKCFSAFGRNANNALWETLK